MVKNQVLAAAYAGAHGSGRGLEPATSTVLMAALLVHDLHTGSGPAHAHPWQEQSAPRGHHPRVWCFGEDAKAAVFCSSADWMERNLFRRVEIAFPILDPVLHAQLREDLALYLSDTADTWLLQSDGSYLRTRDGVAEPVSAQSTLLQRYTGAGTPQGQSGL